MECPYLCNQKNKLYMKTKVMIHFDMDVMNPADIIAAVADGPAGGGGEALLQGGRVRNHL